MGEWDRLPAFDPATIRADDQVLLIASTGGAKSTLTATLTLDVGSLVAIDGKASLTLPRARIVELPPSSSGTFERALLDAIAWRGSERRRLRWYWRLRPPLATDPIATSNRVILRLAIEDIDDLAAHDRVFRALYRYRPHTIVWIDEITATGASPQRVPQHLRALSARGRTRGIGLWTATQAPFGLVPGILRRNARVTIVGPITADDAREMRLPSIEVAQAIAPRTGRFVVYVAGDPRSPYRLFVPIPPALAGWSPP